MKSDNGQIVIVGGGPVGCPQTAALEYNGLARLFAAL